MTDTPKGYWIVHSTVSDPDQHGKYAAAAAPVIAEHGGTYLVRGGEAENPEGELRTRCVVIEFPSYQAALDCHHSEGYLAAKELRRESTVFDLLIVEGFAG